MANEGVQIPFYNPNPYIPKSLGEVHDELMVMIGDAPKFLDTWSGVYPDQNIDSRFLQLTEGFGVVRRKLGEERYAALIDLAARAKALFAADPEDNNGKTDEGIKLIHEMMELIQSTRRRRVTQKKVDDEGEVTGD